MSLNWLALLTATLTIATPLVWASLGELVTERTGVLNLGVEGTMYAGAFVGFLATSASGSPWLGLLAALVTGALAGLLLAALVVTAGLNQHVSGLGLTLLLVAACEFTSRLLFAQQTPRLERTFTPVLPGVPVLGQHWLTYAAFGVLAPLVWWGLRHTGVGYRIRAVGESFEAAAVAGISVNRTRYAALVTGGALMAIGGAFLTVALLGTFTLNIVNGRGWVCIALVIFAQWRVWPAVAGALVFALTDALQLQLAITTAFGGVPRELMLALPYLAVVATLAVWGRRVRYPGSYLRAYRPG